MGGLKLVRKDGESILIHKDGKALARITVNRDERNQSRTAMYFEAPDDVKIVRAELVEGKDK